MTALPLRKATHGLHIFEDWILPWSAFHVQGGKFVITKLRRLKTHRARLTDMTRKLWELVAGIVALLFFVPGSLAAQQAWPGNQGYQNDQYSAQYAPNQSVQQPGYGQPYARPSNPNPGQPYLQQDYRDAGSQAQPLDATQLEQLVAPIALYPDALVGQVLAASTYPEQVAVAARWCQMQGNASPDQIAAGADSQNWDPSVKALTAFPQVLTQMERNLQWTTDLGNAYYNQSQDVLEAVQVLRTRAQSAGNLQSTPQQAVNNDGGYLRVVPANPQVVYVPSYNPWTVYGEQVSPYAGFSPLGAAESFLGSSPINFGLGIAMSAFSHTPWGWFAWGLNWLAQSVLFNQSNYYSHSATVANWGFRQEMHAYSAREVATRHGFDRMHANDGRYGRGFNGNRERGFGHLPYRNAGSWRGNSDRGFQNSRVGYYRTPRQEYGYGRQESRPQVDRRGFGYGLNRGPGEGYRSAGSAYGHSTYAYREPSSGIARRGEFGGGAAAFSNRNFARSAEKPKRAGGFHLFGGGHSPTNVSSRNSGGFRRERAPKSSYGGGRHFGGGHSHGGGGHSGGHSGRHRH